MRKLRQLMRPIAFPGWVLLVLWTVAEFQSSLKELAIVWHWVSTHQIVLLLAGLSYLALVARRKPTVTFAKSGKLRDADVQYLVFQARRLRQDYRHLYIALGTNQKYIEAPWDDSTFPNDAKTAMGPILSAWWWYCGFKDHVRDLGELARAVPKLKSAINAFEVVQAVERKKQGVDAWMRVFEKHEEEIRGLMGDS